MLGKLARIIAKIVQSGNLARHFRSRIKVADFEWNPSLGAQWAGFSTIQQESLFELFLVRGRNLPFEETVGFGSDLVGFTFNDESAFVPLQGFVLEAHQNDSELQRIALNFEAVL